MHILKRLARKKNTFFRGIKFDLINYRYRSKLMRKAFDPAAARRVLLLRLDDKVEGMVVTTGYARMLTKRGYQVSVLIGPIYCEILAGSEFIQQVYLYQPHMSLSTLRAVGLDAVIDFDDITNYERFRLLADLRAAGVVGFNKDQYRLYDHSITFFGSNSHISRRYKQVVKLFGIVDNRPYHYHLPDCRHERERVVCSFSQAGEVELRTATDPFTTSEGRDFCRHQVMTLVERLRVLPYQICIVVAGRSEKTRQLGLDVALYVTDSTINPAIEVIRSCDLVITPDTSIVYIARAFDKPVMAIYNKRKLKDIGLPGYHIWVPDYDKVKQIVYEEANVTDVAIGSVWPVVKEQADRLVAARS